MPARNYKGLYAGRSNTLFVLEGPDVDPSFREDPATYTVWKFDPAKGESKETEMVTDIYVQGWYYRW